MTFSKDTSCDCAVYSAVNFGERAPNLSIDMLLLHYTGMESGEAAIDWLCAEESGVSCHYVVKEDGSLVQLVPEAKRAWHAGKSCWQGEADTNSRSIGIEIVNPGHEYGYPDFPEEQILSVMDLCLDILDRHTIPPRNVLAHSDVAPGRKRDPGEKFPWRQLHASGIGVWVPEIVAEGTALCAGQKGQCVLELQTELREFGYCVEPSGVYDQHTENCVKSFQLHFRQSKVDGIADAGTCAGLASLIDVVT